MNKLLLVSSLVLSLAAAQWLETTVYLPDSAGGVLGPEVAECGSAGSKVYVGGRTPGVAVLDAETGERLYRINSGSSVSAVCENPALGKVYIASRAESTVTVADAGTGRVLSTVRVGEGPIAIEPSADGARVFVACAGSYGRQDSLLYVLDCAADTVAAVYRVGRWPSALLYNPLNNMLYCANTQSNTVSIVSEAGDPVVRTVAVGEAPLALALNSRNNRVYCANYDGITVSVISGITHEVEDEVPVGSGPVALCYDSAANTVFCANEESRNVAVIDGGENRVIAMVALDEFPTELVIDQGERRVYCLADGGNLYVLDAQTNRLVDSLAVSGGSRAMCHSAQTGHLLLPSDAPSSVSVVDCGSLAIAATTRTGIEPEALLLDPTGAKLYCLGGTSPFDSLNVSVIDAASNAVARTFEVRLDGRPGEVCYNDAEDKLYCTGFGTGVGVIDAVADTVLAYVSMPDNIYGLAYAPQENKVFIGGGYSDGYISVIDGRGDTVLATVNVPGGGGVYDVCHNPTRNTLYAFGNQRAVYTVVDCGVDTVIGQFAGEQNPGGSLYNPLTDKVYMAAYVSGVMLVVDGSTHQVRARIDVGNGAGALCLNTADNIVYATGSSLGQLCAVDGATDSLVARLEYQGYAEAVAYDPDHNVVYMGLLGTGDEANAVVLLDGSTQREVGRIDVGAWPGVMAANPAQDRVYLAQPEMSCIRVIRTGAGGVAAVEPVQRVAGPTATHVSGVLFLPASSVGREASSVLLDATGRKVLDLKPGGNDVSRLAPGIYFARTASSVERDAMSVTKVVITR